MKLRSLCAAKVLCAETVTSGVIHFRAWVEQYIFFLLPKFQKKLINSFVSKIHAGISHHKSLLCIFNPLWPTIIPWMSPKGSIKLYQNLILCCSYLLGSICAYFKFIQPDFRSDVMSGTGCSVWTCLLHLLLSIQAEDMNRWGGFVSARL